MSFVRRIKGRFSKARQSAVRASRNAALRASKQAAPFSTQGMRAIRFRLTGLYVLIFGSTLIAFSSALYKVFEHSHQSNFDVALYNHAVDIAGSIHVDPFGELSVDPDILQSGGKIFPFALGRAFIQVRNPRGDVLVRSSTLRGGTLPLKPDDLRAVYRQGYILRTIDFGEIAGRPVAARNEKPTTDYRLLTYLMRNMPEGYVLQVAVPLTFMEFSLGGLQRILLLGIPLTLVAAAFAGLYLSRRALRPIHAAFDSQERFIADASHELKTPVAILRGELDVLRSRDRRPEEVQEFFTSASQELEHLSRIIEDLLLLARVDHGKEWGGRPLEFSRIRLDEIALEAISRLEALARPKGVKLHVDLGSAESGAGDDPASGSEEFLVQGDDDLLRSLVKNLAENAIKFSPEGGTVRIAIEDAKDSVRVSVSDEGPGIPPELISRVFERFYRVPEEGHKVPGAGLGLTIARRIAEAHGGRIEVRSESGKGSTFSAVIKKL